MVIAKDVQNPISRVMRKPVCLFFAYAKSKSCFRIYAKCRLSHGAAHITFSVISHFGFQNRIFWG